jgi:hypothetical protein
MVSPGFKTFCWLSETCSAPVVVIHTSPDDLLTDQACPSPARALEAAPRASAIARMRPNLPALIIELRQPAIDAQTYATGAFNSYLLSAIRWRSICRPRPPIRDSLGLAGCPTMSRSAPTECGSARPPYSEVRPGDVRRLYNGATRIDSFEIRGSVVPLQSQNSTLTLTSAAGFSNVSESDVPRRLAQGRRFSVARRRVRQILGDGSLVHALSNPVQRLVGEDGRRRPDRVRPGFHSQQFYLGGAAFGRGYGSAEISGDNGVANSLELRFDQKLNFRY